MIELLFIIGWTLFILLIGNLLRKHFLGAKRIYVLLSINCLYLAGIFAFYPLVLQVSGKL